jgi:hypothetical protein
MAINSYPADKKGISNSQWTYTAVGGETTLSGYDSKGQPLSYLVNQEQFFLNGVMLVRNVDYTATTGSTITGITALSAGDFVEILTYSNFNVTQVPATQITGTVQNNQLQNNSITLGSTTLSLGGTSTSISGLTIDGTNNIIRTNRGATNPVSGNVAGDIFWNTTSSALQLWNGTSWISFAAPGAPTIGTATDVGTSRAYNNAAASIAFTPNNGGVNATQFFVTSTPGSLTSYGTSSPITLTGLTSGTSYTFTVSAVGSFGNSPASNSTGSLTVTSVPQAPTIGTVTQSANNASVPFTANATGGSSITSYTVTSSSGRTGTGSSSPILVSEITNGNYTYTITATNANGTSLSSNGSNQLIFVVVPTVTGGTLTSDATYYYRTFTNNATLSVSSAALTADVLVVGGGGGGGSWYGGGGGAGGLIYNSAYSLPINTYPIVIGSGGAGRTDVIAGSNTAQSYGSKGIATTFTNGTTSTVIFNALGGGGGPGYNAQGSSTYEDGGSGAGGRPNSYDSGYTYGRGTAGQGNDGGIGNPSGGVTDRGGGGGGAGGVGATGAASGNGGAGLQYFGSYYAGGGGGGAGVGSPTSGGSGVGGAGYGNQNGGNAVANTGSGGGGSTTGPSGATAGGVGGNGSSGIVIVRYTKSQVGG